MQMKNNLDPDQLASDEASWSGSTLFSKSIKKFEKVMYIVCLLGLNIVYFFYFFYSFSSFLL